MLELSNLSLEPTHISFDVENRGGKGEVSLEYVGLGRVSMTDVFDLDFLNDEEMEIIDELMSSFSSLLMYTGRR